MYINNIVFNFRPKASDEVPVKKVKPEPKDADEIKKEKELEKKLVKQDKLYHKYRAALKEYSRSDLQKLMEANAQEVVFSPDEVCKLLNPSHVADFFHTCLYLQSVSAP